MKEIANEVFHGLPMMYLLSVIMMLSVIVAMGIDLASGWRKAKQRGEEHTSYAFSRSLTKFLIYQGIALVGTCIDTMIHFVWAQFASNGSYYFVPVVTAFLCIVLCIVEGWSVKEKASSKERRRMTEAAALVANLLTDDSYKQAILSAVNEKLREGKGGTELNQDNF